MVEVSVLQLMDEIELRHGVHEDRWNILRGILEKQAEREAAQQAAKQVEGVGLWACECDWINNADNLICVACGARR